MSRPPIAVLIIFDGWGLREARESNAIRMARTPVMDRLDATCAHTAIDASGPAVGLLPGVMGNSEVGHLTIGAGRVIYQDVMRISKAIETGDLFANPVLLEAAARAGRDHTLHIWGLLSDGSVHSHIDHLMALLEMAVKQDVANIAVHAVLDGRDKPPRSALPFIDQLEEKLKALGRGRIATVTGRYYAMDRDKRWDRTERAYNAFVDGEGLPGAQRACGGRTVLCGWQERRVRGAHGDWASPSDGRRRPGDLHQFSRRSRPADDGGAGLAGLSGLCPPAPSAAGLRVHDRVRSCLQPAAGVRPRRYPQYSGGAVGSRGST